MPITCSTNNRRARWRISSTHGGNRRHRTIRLYYALNPYIRPQVKSFLEYARSRNAILYYDLNYRRTYKDRIRELLPSIHENFRLADLVRGSADDFEVMYGLRDAEEIYRLHIAPYCPLFLCTCGAKAS